MEIKKFTTYEFDLDAGDIYHVTYKKDELDGERSVIEVKLDEETKKFNVNFLMALYEAMKEVDPFGFVFDDLSENDLGE